MYTKQEAIEAINRGEKFQDKKFNQVRDDLDVSLAYVHEAFIQSRPRYSIFGQHLRLVEPVFIDYISGNLQGQPKALANECSDVGELIFALSNAIKTRDLEASFQKSLTQKQAPKRTIKI